MISAAVGFPGTGEAEEAVQGSKLFPGRVYFISRDCSTNPKRGKEADVRELIWEYVLEDGTTPRADCEWQARVLHDIMQVDAAL